MVMLMLMPVFLLHDNSLVYRLGGTKVEIVVVGVSTRSFLLRLVRCFKKRIEPRLAHSKKILLILSEPQQLIVASIQDVLRKIGKWIWTFPGYTVQSGWMQSWV